MNPLLDKLLPYPFERLRELVRDVRPSAAHRAISLGIGEPRHPTPELIKRALTQSLDGLASYPATGGGASLREAIAGWLQRRYRVRVDPATQVLPVNGSREALFAFAQTVVDPGERAVGQAPVVICPNPFYQIYEGATLLAGGRTVFVNSQADQAHAPDWSVVDQATWQATRLVYVCTPGNPTGRVMTLDEWRWLFEMSDRHGFVVASDECYSEIYFRDEAPLGGLQAAVQLGRTDFQRLVVFSSLSKRSNVPGLRSGFVAGDAACLKQFLRYRTYHGGAMGPPVQAASIAAWSDEVHVEENRRLYRRKFEQVTPLLREVMDVEWPDAGFYLWAKVRSDAAHADQSFARDLLAQYNVTVLPGSFLARDAHGVNPGAGRVRMALVADVDECLEAAGRIVSFLKTWPS